MATISQNRRVDKILAVQALNAAFAVDSQKLGGVNADQYVLILDPRLSDARNPLPGSSNYIQNTAVQQSATFNISGSAIVGGDSWAWS